MPKADTSYAAFTYEVESSNNQQGTYKETDPQYYVAKLIAALLPQSAPPLTKAAEDMARNIELHVGLLPVDHVYNKDPEALSALKIERIRKELQRIAQQAQHEGKSWVTTERIQAVLDHLSQNFIGNTFVVVSKNSTFQCTEAGGIPLPKLVPLSAIPSQSDNFSALHELMFSPLKLTIDGSIITFEFTADAFAYAGSEISDTDNVFIHEHAKDPAVHDIRIVGKISIDFDRLSQNDGMFEPQTKAITQTVAVKSLMDDIIIKLNANLAALKTTDTRAPEIEAPKSWLRIILDAITSFFDRIFNFVAYVLFFRKNSDAKPTEDYSISRKREDSSSSIESTPGLLESVSYPPHPPAVTHRKRDLLLGYPAFNKKRGAALSQSVAPRP